MNDLEERVRRDLHAIADTVVAAPLADHALAAARTQRIRRSLAVAGIAVVTAAIVVTVNVLAGGSKTRNEPARKPPPVGSYFPAMQPPLPPRVVVQQLPASARPADAPTREDVIAADRAFWEREPSNPKWQHLAGPPSGGDVRSADLVLVSTPGYERPAALGKVVNRVAWMLVSTNARYVYEPPPTCPVPARGPCRGGGGLQTIVGNRFEFVDAKTGAGLLAIGTKADDPKFATTVTGYVRAELPPPSGARGLTGGPVPLNAIDVVLPAPKHAHPAITQQQAYDAYTRFDLSRSAPLDSHSHSAELVSLAHLEPPHGDPDYQDATWHQTLVWLVVVRGVRLEGHGGPARAPGTSSQPVRSCVGAAVYPVDANTGRGLFFETGCGGDL
jgi:hypothetical protein